MQKGWIFWVCIIVTIQSSLLQICWSCFSQRKGENEVLQYWVQVSCALFSNLHLWGNTYCRFPCVLCCNFLLITSALTWRIQSIYNNFGCIGLYAEQMNVANLLEQHWIGDMLRNELPGCSVSYLASTSESGSSCWNFQRRFPLSLSFSPFPFPFPFHSRSLFSLPPS